MSLKLIRIKEVMDRTGLARSTVYKYIAEGCFPKGIKLGARAVAWVESEIETWIEQRIQLRVEVTPSAGSYDEFCSRKSI